MSPRNTRVLVFATALLTAPLLPGWAQAPVHPRPQPKKEHPKSEVIIKSDTPIEQGDPQAQQGQQPATQDQGTAAQGPPQGQGQPGTAPQGQPPGTATQDQGQAQAQGQGTAPGQATAPKGGVAPEQIGLSFAPPQGWQQGDPTKFAVPGTICCVWSPDNASSIAVFVQNSGKPYNPRVLLDQSAEGLQKSLGAEVRQKDIINVGGMKGFSLVVSGAGTGAGIDGKGSIRTDQHWVAVPRDKDVVIFLMTTADDKFAANEAAFQAMLSSLKITGTQTPDQQAAK